jgi:hypothetical protein
MTNRDEFNARVDALGLTVIKTATDGWYDSFVRPDGLHLWRIASSGHGCGIQTAWDRNNRYEDHMPVYADKFVDALNLAVQRDRKPTMWVVFWTLCGATRSFRDHFVICDDQEEAQTKLKDLFASVDNLYCAGIAPIFDSTEHWHE